MKNANSPFWIEAARSIKTATTSTRSSVLLSVIGPVGSRDAFHSLYKGKHRKISISEQSRLSPSASSSPPPENVEESSFTVRRYAIYSSGRELDSETSDVQSLFDASASTAGNLSPAGPTAPQGAAPSQPGLPAAPVGPTSSITGRCPGSTRRSYNKQAPAPRAISWAQFIHQPV
ncbi:hypothetical protein Bbelb_350240 [Branchiostoma belcheri]|nr:hypothetical protein Bbelb_350240 [Branchiostoma belcheri]